MIGQPHNAGLPAKVQVDLHTPHVSQTTIYLAKQLWHYITVMSQQANCPRSEWQILGGQVLEPAVVLSYQDVDALVPLDAPELVGAVGWLS